jgi:hypothetical protein
VRNPAPLPATLRRVARFEEVKIARYQRSSRFGRHGAESGFAKIAVETLLGGAPGDAPEVKEKFKKISSSAATDRGSCIQFFKSDGTVKDHREAPLRLTVQIRIDGFGREDRSDNQSHSYIHSLPIEQP